MNNGFPIIISLIACFAVGFTYSKYRKYKRLYIKEVDCSVRNIREFTRHMTEQQIQINELKRQLVNIADLRNRLSEALAKVQYYETGWWPANKSNCNANSRFKYRGELLVDEVKYFTNVGPVFKRNGFIEFNNLLVFVGKIR